MTATDIAAWLGALTGTLALVWDIFKWARGGARVEVSASGNMVMVGGGVAGQNGPFISVEARNVGDGRTTITNVVGFYYRSWYKRLVRRPPDENFLVPHPLPGRLPHILETGERWLGLMEQTEDMIKKSQVGWLYIGIFHSTSKGPVVVRVVIRPKVGAQPTVQADSPAFGGPAA